MVKQYMMNGDDDDDDELVLCRNCDTMDFHLSQKCTLVFYV